LIPSSALQLTSKNNAVPSILAFGSYLPTRILSNAELATRLGCDPAWILQASGIEERHVADTESVTEMGANAGRDCLAHASVPVGLVLVSCASGERRFPGPAAEIATLLGLPGTPAIDLPIASAGGLFAIALASGLTATFGNVLVVATEIMSPSATDRDTAILFGDGAGACVVSSGHGSLEILASVLHSDGEGSSALQWHHTGPVEMNGLAVIRHASARIPAVINEALAKASLSSQFIKAFVMHQANQNVIDRVSRALGVPSTVFYSNIRRRGNTSSASMLIAAAEWFPAADLVLGDAVCFAAFGAGFHWGAIVARAT
jgi:3-oxoacyl-[acyl-carrier-protein] synthase-3